MIEIAEDTLTYTPFFYSSGELLLPPDLNP